MIELISDVGGGKTAFTTGLAKGAGSLHEVSSPSFTINQIYETPHFVINHYDFYRLADPGIMSLELHEAVADPATVVVVEWGSSVEDTLPANRLKVVIRAEGENEREFEFSASENIDYLLDGLDTLPEPGK